jgi:hypothetical protein
VRDDPLKDRPVAAGTSRTDESEERAHGGSPGIRGEAPRQTTHGLTSTTADTTSATDPKILRHFTRRGRALAQKNYTGTRTPSQDRAHERLPALVTDRATRPAHVTLKGVALVALPAGVVTLI